MMANRTKISGRQTSRSSPTAPWTCWASAEALTNVSLAPGRQSRTCSSLTAAKFDSSGAVFTAKAVDGGLGRVDPASFDLDLVVAFRGRLLVLAEEPGGRPFELQRGGVARGRRSTLPEAGAQVPATAISAAPSAGTVEGTSRSGACAT